MLQRITCFHLPQQSKVLLSTQGVQIGGLGTLLMVHFNASWRRQQQYPGLNAPNAHTSSSSRACMSFHFGINGQIRRSHISFLQRSAHRLLVQPYLIRSTISCIEATMSLQHFLNSVGAFKDRGTIRRGSIFGEFHNGCAVNSSSNNIHGPNATSAPHQCLASPALLHDENRRSQLDRSRS
ncbi:hypothetical protein DL98DRAFT_135497 [Cadophora sp. DSE1049]|nr:hypothetical protein DL98DRAFT_135497 [Cadophora sp. DSE1049]